MGPVPAATAEAELIALAEAGKAMTPAIKTLKLVAFEGGVQAFTMMLRHQSGSSPTSKGSL